MPEASNLIRNIKMSFSRNYMRVCATFYPIKKKIVFMSFGGKTYSDNPRAISEKIHEMYPDYEIVWIIDVVNDSYKILPNYVRVVKNGLSRYKEISSAFCYVTNVNIDPDLTKRKGQLFIQTWHGDGGFKKILYDNSQGRTQHVPVADNILTDICMAGSLYGEKKYRNAFRYQGEILLAGCARNDRLIHPNSEEISAIKRQLNINEEYKILLYAPTFRKKKNKEQVINVELEEVIQHLSQKDNSKWVCLIRSHPSAKLVNTYRESMNIINVSMYPDMADLLLIADFLITDYSSCSLDFALTHKPVILAAFDRNEYVKNERGMTVALEDTGYIFAETQKELIEKIDMYSEEDYCSSCEKVLLFYGSKETGEASLRICEIINERYDLQFKKGK